MSSNKFNLRLFPSSVAFISALPCHLSAQTPAVRHLNRTFVPPLAFSRSSSISPTQMASKLKPIANCHLVFVYGTLKEGFPNAHVMPQSITYAGTAHTKFPYPLVVDNQMAVPFLLDLPSHPRAECVQGELYFVDDEALKFLDEFEGLHNGYYVRNVIQVVPEVQIDPDTNLIAKHDMQLSSVMDAGAYFRCPSNGGPDWCHTWTVDRLQTLPMYSKFTKEHACTYVERGER